MAIITYQIYTGQGVQYLSAGNAARFVVTVPAGGPAVTCTSDAQGLNVLATVAAGTSANFSAYSGFFYQSPLPGGATVVASSIKLVSNPAFTTVANLGTEAVTAQLLLPAGLLFNTGILKIRYQIKCTGVTSTPTLAAKLYLGGVGTTADTAIQTVATTAILANGIITGEMEIAVTGAPGATVGLIGTGSFSLAGAAGQAVVNSTLTSTNFATNAPLYVTLTLLWSAASASNIASATLFDVTLL